MPHEYVRIRKGKKNAVACNNDIFIIPGNNIPKWSEKDGGYKYHVVSSVMEWTSALTAMGYFLTYAPEFRNIHLHEPELIFDEPLIHAWQISNGSDSDEPLLDDVKTLCDIPRSCAVISDGPIIDVGESVGEKMSVTARSSGRLFSLSMSLLLAAFLQAVRCLTMFLDDTLKNI